jgi:hypothetical protein
VIVFAVTGVGWHRFHVRLRAKGRSLYLSVSSSYIVVLHRFHNPTNECLRRSRDLPPTYRMDWADRLPRAVPSPLVAYALARFPPASVPLQARRLHPAVPAGAGL